MCFKSLILNKWIKLINLHCENYTHSIKPYYKTWDSNVFSYKSLQTFLTANSFKGGIHAINVNGYLVDFLFQKKPSDNLLVVFGGATARGPERKPPFFPGRRIATHLDCSVMCINDPGLYLDDNIRLAWYAGSKYLPLQSILPTIIDKVASFLHTSRIIMTGGSGGGFASLFYATKTAKTPIAFVYNPQTNIIRYRRGHIQDFARVCFEWQEGDFKTAFSDITYDLVQHYSGDKPPIIYLQNSTDGFHIKNHAIPFLKNFGLDWTGTDQAVENLYLHVNDWGSHHTAPDRLLIQHIIKQLCRREVPLDEVVNLAIQEMAKSVKSKAIRSDGSSGNQAL